MTYILKQLPIGLQKQKQIPCDYKTIGKCFRLYCKSLYLTKITDYGHPDRAFFQKFETFGLGQTNWAEIL